MKIQLKDFPDEIYIKLKKDYKNKLFEELSNIKLDELKSQLKISKTTIIEWKKRAKYLPLKKIKHILKLIKKEKDGELEKNIISYTTKKSKLIIKNPNFPIEDSKELREITVHIMCDGVFSSGYLAYYNIDKNTKEEFIKKLNKCFGNVEYKFYDTYLHFPPAIALILKKTFNVEFNSKKCRIPKEFFKGNRKKLCGIIRAAIIDEGTIDNTNIRIDSCNKEFLNDLRVICQKANYKCGEIWESKGPIFRLNILAESIQQLNKDMKEIPIAKKQTLINIIEENQKRGWKYKLPGEVKKEILKSLLEKPKKKIELILELRLIKTTLGKHISWFIEKEIISYKTNKNIRTYFVKDKIKAQEFISNPSKFIKSEKINNYGISQLKLLKILNRKIKRYSEIEKQFEFSKAAIFKLVSSLKKKEFIKKKGREGWIITSKGKKVLKLKDEEARYILYSNTKKF